MPCPRFFSDFLALVGTGKGKTFKPMLADDDEVLRCLVKGVRAEKLCQFAAWPFVAVGCFNSLATSNPLATSKDLLVATGVTIFILTTNDG